MSDFETLSDEYLATAHGGCPATAWVGPCSARVTMVCASRRRRVAVTLATRTTIAVARSTPPVVRARCAQFYREMSRTRPTELFYDPMGGMKHGRNIGAIGGHRTHVHVAY